MITTVYVSINWPDNSPGPAMLAGVETTSIRDPRILLGVQQALAKRMGVTQAPDLVTAKGSPYFAVSLDDRPDTSMFSERMRITTLLEYLTEPITVNVAFASDGGWKTSPATVDVEVI